MGSAVSMVILRKCPMPKSVNTKIYKNDARPMKQMNTFILVATCKDVRLKAGPHYLNVAYYIYHFYM